MDLTVAVDAPSIKGHNVETGDGLVAHNHIQVTLLTELVASGRQQLDVV